MSTPVTDGPPTRMRATNADRDQVAALIDGSVANGSLSAEEGAERVGFVRSAVYRDEFDALLADLPIAQASPAVAAVAPSSSASPRGRFGDFLAAHRVWSWIVAAVVVLLLVAGVVLAATDGFGEGGHHDRGGSHGETQHDGHR